MMNEVVYANGTLIKIPFNTENTMINLESGVISTYSFDIFHSTKSSDNSIVNTKYYKNEYQVEDGIKVIGSASSEDETEKYYSILNIDQLSELSNKYGLPLPISTNQMKSLEDSFSDWHMEMLFGGVSDPVIASVKFNLNNSPTMLKLYRGNYTPTDEEIQKAKEYWENVPS